MGRRKTATLTDSLGRERKPTRAKWGKVRRLPSGRLQASYVGPDGARYTAPTTYTTQTDADGWLSAQRADIERGKWKSPRMLTAETFGTYAAAWLDHRTTRNGDPLRPKTRAEYTRILAAGLSPFATDRIAAITPARVRAWHADRMKGSGATMAGNEARLLRAILTTAMGDDLIDRNPVPAQLTRSSTGKAHRMPTLAELGVMIDTIDPRYRVAILLAAYGGLRLSEWRALRRQDVTLTRDIAMVRVERQALHIGGDGWHATPPKSSEGVRTVVLPRALASDIEQHLAEHVGLLPGDLLFPPPSGGEGYLHDRTWNRAWDRARDAAGVRTPITDKAGKLSGHTALVREHDLRHFAGTHHAQGGATMKQTMAFLGHSTPSAAMRYQHALDERAQELADAMPLPPAKPVHGVVNIDGKRNAKG